MSDDQDLTPEEEQEQEDAGVIAALMERLEKVRLPRALALKEQVERGEPLGSTDIAFLKKVYADSKQARSLVERHPEYHELAARLMTLYTEIIDKGIANEDK